MGAVVALDTLFNGGQVWKGRPAPPAARVPASSHDRACFSGGMLGLTGNTSRISTVFYTELCKSSALPEVLSS